MFFCVFMCYTTYSIGGYQMKDSLLELKQLIDTGAKPRDGGTLARLRGFEDGREYSRYRKWLTNTYPNISSTEEFPYLDWWRQNVDYKSRGKLLRSLKEAGYNIKDSTVVNFNMWCRRNKYTHSNLNECLELFNTYMRKSENAVNVLKGGEQQSNHCFKDIAQKRRYDYYCRSLGFSITSDRERYLSGIDTWLKEIDITKSPKQNLPKLSTFFDTKREIKNFRDWRSRNNISTSTEEELLSAVNTYKEVLKYYNLRNNMPWKDSSQRERYLDYCTKNGIIWSKDPKRYVLEFDNWSVNIDPGPYVDVKSYFSSEEQRESFMHWCRRRGCSAGCFRSRGFQERYEKWKNWYENERDAKYFKK